MKGPVSLLKYSLEYADYFLSFKRKSSLMRTSKHKKNILFIVYNLAMGGAEKVVLNIARMADRKKLSFHIIPTMPVNHTWYSRFSLYFENVIIPVKRVSGQFLLNKYFYELIKRLDIDLVLVSNSTRGYRFLPKLKSEYSHIKTLDILHAEKNVCTTIGLEKQIIPCLDKRVCVGNQLKKYMFGKYKELGIESPYSRRLVLIRNGIEMKKYQQNRQGQGKFKAQFGIPSCCRLISFIGRFDPVKNTSLFVEIAETVIKKTGDHKLKFVMAGEGSELHKTKMAIKNKNLQDYFIFPGAIDNIPQLLADTYLLLVTSKSEGLPLVITEAMAMETPVISTNVGGVGELIEDRVNGYLVSLDTNAAEQFASKILDLLSGKLDYGKLGQKAKRTVASKYSLETMGKKYSNLFKELLAT